MTNDKQYCLLRCDNDKGELRIKTSLVKELEAFIEKHKRRKKFKLEIRARFSLDGSSSLDEIFSAPPSVLMEWASTLKISVPGYGMYGNKDLDKGRYEGGLKVWEATADMIKFINEDQQFVGKLLERNQKLNVLDLGCGAGLVSLAFISRLLAHENFDSNYRIHVQDYNWEVLGALTLLNYGFNLPNNYLEALIKTRSLKLFFGDWSKFCGNNNGYQYDLIMTSETIYDAHNFCSLHDLLDKHLKVDGHIIIATKDTYFGLSGGLYSWLDYLSSRNNFVPVNVIKVSQDNVPRSILVLGRKPPQ